MNPMGKIKKFNQFGELILEKGGQAFDNLFRAAVVKKLNDEVKPQKSFTPPPPRPRPNISNKYTPKETKIKPPTQSDRPRDTPKPSSSSWSGRPTKFEFDPDFLSSGSRLGGELSRVASGLFGKARPDYETEERRRRASQPWFKAPTLSDLFSFFVDSMSGPSGADRPISKPTFAEPMARPKYEEPSPKPKYEDPLVKKLLDEERERKRREKEEAWEIYIGKRPAPPATEAEKRKMEDWYRKMGVIPETEQDKKAIEEWKNFMDTMTESPKTEQQKKTRVEKELNPPTDLGTEPVSDYPRLQLTMGCGINGVPLPGIAFGEFKSVFPDETFSMVAEEISVGPDVSYQWQVSLNGNEWFNLRGKREPKCSLTQTEDRYYRMMSTCNSSAKSNVTNVVLVKMNSQKLIGMRRDLQVSFDLIDKTLQKKVEEFVIKFMVPIFEKYEIKIKERPESKIQLVTEMDDEIGRMFDMQRSTNREVVDTILYLISLR